MSYSSKDIKAAVIMSRFGLGAKSDGFSPIATDPLGALEAEIDASYMPRPQGELLAPTPELLRLLFAYQEDRKLIREQTKQASPAPIMTAPDNMAKDMSGGDMAPKTPPKTQNQAVKDLNPVRDIELAEVNARFCGTYQSPAIGFNERLVMFWTNHFAIAVNKGEADRIIAGAYEREAIRPHVFGRFYDMLLAVETHPAMLLYLDNAQSIGPHSRSNRFNKRGLNENLAREIMELHTLGVGSGYSQTDVTNFAKVITGWTIKRNNQPNIDGVTGGFVFNANTHELGSQTILGHNYYDTGFDQGKTVLKNLAASPATAQHLSYKLARHFISDTPPLELVARMKQAYLDTDGDLSALYRILIHHEAAVMPQQQKMRTPTEFLAAILRVSEAKPKPNQIIGALKAMGQPLWEPGGPNGFEDSVAAWSSPEGLSTRMEFTNQMANQLQNRIDARSLIEAALGPILSQDSRNAVAHAQSGAEALTIAFLTPEFMRR